MTVQFISVPRGKRVRIGTTVRRPLASEVRRLAEQENRTDSEMVAQLVDEAVKERASKGLARVV